MNKNPIMSLAILCLTMSIAACSSSSGGGGDNDPPPDGGGGGGGGATGPEAVTVLLGDSVKNVLIQPGTPTQISFTYTMPNDLFSDPYTSYFGFSMNLADTMPAVQLTSAPVANNSDSTGFDPWVLAKRVLASDLFGKLIGIERLLAAANATVTGYVSYPGDPEVCNTGAMIGPYTFTGDVDNPWTSDSDSESVSGVSPRIHIVKTGSFEVCIAISALTIPMDAYLTVDAFQVEATPCEEEPPADSAVLGSWSGTWSCDNFGVGDDVDQPITLSISKNGDGTYSYTDDGGASYTGHFCGTKFRFTGGLDGSYTESGTFWLTGTGTANKTSTWNSVPLGFSGGDCTDTLTKD